MKKIIKNNFIYLYKFLIAIKRCFPNYSKKTYSQFGEDIVLSTFLSSVENGFYVDIGAYHPFKFSNTYFYYKKGWRGINIDAKPGSMSIFNKTRPRDKNLEVGISKSENKMDFYIFKESAYNTFSKQQADLYIEQGINFDKKEHIDTKSIESILNIYLPMNQEISFMTIDVEGMDLQVLESNNWSKYIPKYILIEMHDIDIENIKDSVLYRFLYNKGYKLVSFVYITLIFKYDPRT